jgi:hypothetical protein
VDFLLMLSLRSHHQTHGHLDVLLCLLLGVLWFCTLWLRSILSFCEVCKICVHINFCELFCFSMWMCNCSRTICGEDWIAFVALSKTSWIRCCSSVLHVCSVFISSDIFVLSPIPLSLLTGSYTLSLFQLIFSLVILVCAHLQLLDF